MLNPDRQETAPCFQTFESGCLINPFRAFGNVNGNCSGARLSGKKSNLKTGNQCFVLQIRII